MNIIKKIIQNNFWQGRKNLKPKFIFLHTYDGGGTSLYNWFNRPTTQASAHFAVMKDGTVEQYVEDENTAWGNGTGKVTLNGITVENMNLISFSIEHQDDKNPQDSVRTPELYESSAQLVAYLCKKWNIPCNRDWIKGHRDLPGVTKSCPGGLDMDRIVARAYEILNPQPKPEPVQPEYVRSARDIPQTRYIADKDLTLVEIATGKAVQAFSEGSEFDISRITTFNGQEYAITPYSAGKNIWNGIPLILLVKKEDMDKVKAELAQKTKELQDLQTKVSTDYLSKNEVELHYVTKQAYDTLSTDYSKSRVENAKTQRELEGQLEDLNARLKAAEELKPATPEVKFMDVWNKISPRIRYYFPYVVSLISGLAAINYGQDPLIVFGAIVTFLSVWVGGLKAVSGIAKDQTKQAQEEMLK